MSAVFALAYHHLQEIEYLDLAKKLCKTCSYLYDSSGRGLGAEKVEFLETKEKLGYRIVEGKYILRPEFVESLYYLYKVTKDEFYRDEA
jgi:mannosyl-oligosaccharide alpha-1,2-mannosidase